MGTGYVVDGYVVRVALARVPCFWPHFRKDTVYQQHSLSRPLTLLFSGQVVDEHGLDKAMTLQERCICLILEY
jgi:hypothetical protein